MMYKVSQLITSPLYSYFDEYFNNIPMVHILNTGTDWPIGKFPVGQVLTSSKGRDKPLWKFFSDILVKTKTMKIHH